MRRMPLRLLQGRRTQRQVKRAISASAAQEEILAPAVCRFRGPVLRLWLSAVLEVKALRQCAAVHPDDGQPASNARPELGPTADALFSRTGDFPTRESW
jgi:hypothetical protein